MVNSTHTTAHSLQALIEPLIAAPNAVDFSRLCQSFEVFNFELGEPLFSLENSSDSNAKRQDDRECVYIICQGKVRLLSLDKTKKREVSVGLLTAGEIFGGESVLGEEILPYRAVAASAVEVARISLSQLQPWLEQLSSLRENCLASLKAHQRLIFYKTLTELRSLSSGQIEQILPYIEEKTIAAGESLARATPAEVGRFWLRRGQVHNQSLEIGSSWGYPDTTPADWVAVTDLWVYGLAKQNWEALEAISTALAKSSGVSSPPPAPKASTPITAPPETPPPQPKEAQVEFAKPLKRRRRWGRNYPLIEQQSATDCGAACLAMISRYWGKRFSINSLRNLAGVGRVGASLKNLAKAAETLGYEARPVRASLNRLAEENPWIAHWQGDHYVVVYRIKGDRLLVADPAMGKRFLSRQTFLASWTGYALLLNPTPRLQANPDEKRSLGRYLGLLLPYRAIGLQIILASLLIQLFGLVSPLFTQIILDQVVVNKSLTTLHVFALGVLLFGVWKIGLSAVRQYLLSYLSNRLDLTMLSGFIRHALMLPLHFFESRHVGDILTRVSENQKIQRFLVSQVVLAWLDFLMGFVYLGLMLYYNWQLTLLVVALIPPIVILTLGATPFLRQISREVFNRAAGQNSALVETITGVSTVKATAAERELRWRWEDRLTDFLNARFRSQKLGINLQAASSLINSLGSTALLWYGALLVIQDQLTIGQFVAFNMLVGKVMSPVLALANLWDELQEVLISVERLDDVFCTPTEETAQNSLLVLPSLRGEVRFEGVTFRYSEDQEQNTLENLTFEVNAGETIAIVGRSGSGKTTLVKLLQAFYYPSSGQIWIDGHDIEHISPQSLRSQTGVVPQECYLFSGTILENIALYRPQFSLEQVVEVAKLAEAHAFIQSMPLGYSTKVGERGANLSGGQRQRIAIARALLGEPRILILDEATSSLDTESERRFQENLGRLSRDRTTFIIAHRLSTVRSADCILVLDRGVLVEKGTHEQLIAKKGLYYHLAQQQISL